MKTSFFNQILWLLNLVAGAALALSYLAAFISPAKAWWLALFGLGYEIILLLNLLFLIYWFLRRNRRYWFSLILILAGITKLMGIYKINFSNSEKKLTAAEKKEIKVMSFNVRLFDLYNWYHDSETKNKILEFLSQESPDIICFQEYYSTDHKNSHFQMEDTLKKILSAAAHIEYTLNLHEGDHWGIATYSKYPILNKKAVRFQTQGRDIFMYTDILAGGDTIRIFNTHLESIRFRWQDYKFIENVGNDEMNQDDISGGLNIIRRLKRAFEKRADQVMVLHDALQASPYPVVLCGDFNDTPSSYTYHILADDLADAFRQSGSGFGKTYTGPFPSFRIDYIFHDPKFRSFSYKTHQVELSDHYPISCSLELP